MNVLVIGNGGREHAVIQALKKSPKVDKIYAMKGNAGIGELAELVDVDYCDAKAVGDWIYRGYARRPVGTRRRGRAGTPRSSRVRAEPPRGDD